MPIATELSVRLPNSTGALARVCDLLARERIDIRALCLEPGGTLRLVVDNPLHAQAVLEEARHTVQTRDVIVSTVANRPGSLAGVARLLADADLDIEYAWGAAEEGAAQALVVVAVPNAMEAASAAGL